MACLRILKQIQATLTMPPAEPLPAVYRYFKQRLLLVFRPYYVPSRAAYLRYATANHRFHHNVQMNLALWAC